ncbi:cell wall metabolism sensor histidine kinase WalK [Clostridium swellfunianum]|uniref:two-component system histidine kinase PnpS n=1 Tax=Clostridium swellfunianum TaxID=1367462 RepID=UPI00203064DB|nr:ATP-binding protein [Clostridium swellfunianum]MCM0648745.1 cell wall metabolism sensor histidine kinase WalK [Clostridium swellfunianum]
MKRKLIQSILSVLICSVIILTIFFIKIINNQYSQNLQHNLQSNNAFVISLINSNNVLSNESFFKTNLSNIETRVTYIDKSGNVLLDSKIDNETMNNHNNRPEIIQARQKGYGYSVRYSESMKKNMLYAAAEFNDGFIMRSSLPLEFINSFENRYVKSYIIVIVGVILSASVISSRLSQVILKPIKDLQHITFRVANGELFRRVKILSNDEIGELGKAFNDMADKLQKSIKEVTERQTKLEAILKSMDSGVIAVDKNHKVIMINPYAEEIFGINKDIIGQDLMHIIKDFELESIFNNTTDQYTELKLLWPKERDLRIRRADIINDNELIGTVAVVQDITDIKRLENMRSQFVANVSHELKTPLTSIKGFAETLKFVEDPQKRDKFLDIINDEAERLTRLINDILTLSYIEQHKEIKSELFNVNQVIQDVYYLMKNTAENKKINLKTEINKDIMLKGDIDKFKQMLINLVDNAIKYSEEGDRVFIGADIENNKKIIWVEDTGVGMSKEHLSRIFERFYRVDKARSRAQGGTGLGLAIVKHIVLSLNGSINVESEVGKGTKFTVKIPF